MRSLLVAVLLMASVHGAAFAAQPELTCAVREALQPAPGAQLRVGAGKQALEGGYEAIATARAVRQGRRVDVSVRDTTGKEREIVLACTVRLPGAWTHVFVTDGAGPRPLGEKGSAVYRGSCSLPAITVYGEEAGVTVAAPFEVPAPTLTFSWAKTGDGVEVTATVSSRRLPAGGEATTGLLVGQHEGCWRPGLGWLVDLYPEYFNPPNPKVYECDGPMIYDFITTEERLRRDLTQDLSWQELGWYWPHLGLYLPGESWQHQPSSEGGYGQGGLVTQQMIRDYLARTKRLGIAECLYFQSTESWAEYAERNFPESRIRRADGAFAPTWVKCVVMDPDPDGRFGQHILSQITKLMDAFPDMAGVFWDQNCYTGFDFAHDDGVSMVNGRRVSMMEFPQVRMLEQGSKLLHDRGKIIMTNGGWTAGLARYCDGHMSEGNVPTRRLQYLCINKHLTLLSYDSNLRASREKLLLALETGAQPAVTLGKDACREMFAGYRPIFRQLRRKSWVFTPRALEMPEGTRGNIFRTAEGNYLVTAIADETKRVPLAQIEQPVTAVVRVPDSREIGAIFAYNPGLQGLQAVRTRRQGEEVEVTIARPADGAAVLLARRGRYVASATERLIAGRKQPVAVVVANLTERAWNGAWRFEVDGRTVQRTLKLPPFKSAQVALGEVAVGAEETPLTIRVSLPPGARMKTAMLQVPVVAPVAVHLPGEGIVPVMQGAAIEYAVANRTEETLPVSARAQWRGAAETEAQRLTLGAGETRVLSVAAELEGGLHELRVAVESAAGRAEGMLRADVLHATLPQDFGLEQAEGLSVSLDVFNSLGGQWADKPVQVNGVAAGPLPITGCTLKWHEGLTVPVGAEAARRMLQAGLADNGDITLTVTVGNGVKNCFKVRNVQVTIVTAAGRIVSTTDRTVHCSDPGWLYSEGECTRLGTTVTVGQVKFLREH